MALRKRGTYQYGDSWEDIRTAILQFSTSNSYVAEHFASPVCGCSGRVFGLVLDEDAGVAVRRCVLCETVHTIGDGDEYIAEADLQECACPCGKDMFEITVGVALYADSEDVQWLYLGCRCPACYLTAVYGDWKNEFIGYRTLLAKI